MITVELKWELLKTIGSTLIFFILNEKIEMMVKTKKKGNNKQIAWIFFIGESWITVFQLMA